MLANEWSNIDTISNELSPSDSILAQALPGSLAAPAGWRSEILDASSSIPGDIGTDLTDTSTSLFEKHEEYKTLNSLDAPPIIFSSTNDVNRTVNEIPSSSAFSPKTMRRSRQNEYINTMITESANEAHKTFLTKEQQNVKINFDDQQSPPLIVRKTLPDNTVTYEQNVSVRYLQPPTPPPPGPIIIREIRPPPPAPPSPVQIRQRPPPPVTPPPIIIREKPPPAPTQLPSQVVEKLLPPPPRPPRRMIVERFASCPPKPPDVVIERWLPYRRTDRRKVLFERAPTSYRQPPEPNLLILHDQPHARVHKEFINQGVTRADPLTYLQRYGSEIDSWHNNSKYGHLISEATRTLPPPHPLAAAGDHYGSYSHHYPPNPIASVSNAWDRMRSASPIPYSLSNVWERMRSASPLPYSSSYHDDSVHRYSRPSPYHYGDYPESRTMIDVTSTWGRNCQSRLPSYDFSPSHHPNTIQVNSDGELDHVLSGLTRDRASSSYRFY